MQGPLGMIFVSRRHTESGHDCVADELLDCPAGALDLLGHRGVEALQQRACSLGILLSELGRADEVGEQHGRELPLVPCRRRLGRPVGRGERRLAGWEVGRYSEVERWILPQDRSLELSECMGRLDAELFDKRAASVLVGIERLRLPARAVESEHQLRAEAFAERVQFDERTEFPYQLRMPSELEIRFAPPLQGREAQLLQTRDLCPREPVIGEVGERRPAPERERLPQRLGAALRDERLEALEIELSLLDAEQVAARLRRDPLTTERFAQPGHVDLEGLLRRLWRRLLPECINEAIC